MNIVWDESFSTGIEEIDSQHKDFIKIIQRLEILRRQDSSQEFVRRVLLELLKYTEYHFVSEENMMIVIGYPWLLVQQREHTRLLRTLNYKIDALQESLETLDDTIHFLTQWTIHHIKKEDGKIGDFVNERMNRTESEG